MRRHKVNYYIQYNKMYLVYISSRNQRPQASMINHCNTELEKSLNNTFVYCIIIVDDVHPLWEVLPRWLHNIKVIQVSFFKNILLASLGLSYFSFLHSFPMSIQLTNGLCLNHQFLHVLFLTNSCFHPPLSSHLRSTHTEFLAYRQCAIRASKHCLRNQSIGH